MKQYQAHWENPSETPIMWIGLLFSMLSLIMLSFYLNDEEPPEYEGTSHSLYELYRLRTAQCLMMGDITSKWLKKNSFFYSIISHQSLSMVLNSLKAITDSIVTQNVHHTQLRQ
jgi:hypothetical protein